MPAVPQGLSTARTTDVASGPTLAGTSLLCTSYADCAAKGYSDAGYKAASGRSYWQMYSGVNCTNYAAYRIIAAGGPASRPWSGSGMARNWGVAMPSITNGTPAVGSIAWWRAGVGGAGSGGHVAYVERVVSPTEIVVSESNWGRNFDWRTISATGNAWPSGFMHFLSAPPAPAPAPPPPAPAPPPPAPTTPAPQPATLANVSLPVVEGEARVGRTLTANPGGWNMSASYTYEWLADGEVMSRQTGPTFVPRKARLGQTISVAVTASAPGQSPVRATSAPTAPIGPSTLAVTAPAGVSGRPHVDDVLTATPPAWAQAPEAVTTQWLADGQPVAGATGPTFVPGQAEIGRSITVQFTAVRTGFDTTVAESAPVGPVGADEMTLAAEPVLAGSAVIGKELRVENVVVQPADAVATYTWLRDGTPMRNAGNTPSYTVKEGDRGKEISVRVSWHRPGFRDLVRTLTLGSTAGTQPRLSVEATGARRAVVVRVRVQADGVKQVRGKVTVSVGAKSRTASLSRGRAVVRVRKVKPGDREIRVSYGGSKKVAASEAVASARVARG